MSYNFFQCLHMRTHANLHCGLLLQPAWHAWLGSPLRAASAFDWGPSHPTILHHWPPLSFITSLVVALCLLCMRLLNRLSLYMHCTTSMPIRARWTQPTKLLLGCMCVCVSLGKRWQAPQTCGRSLAPIITLSSCCKDFHVGFELCVCVCVGII